MFLFTRNSSYITLPEDTKEVSLELDVLKGKFGTQVNYCKISHHSLLGLHGTKSVLQSCCCLAHLSNPSYTQALFLFIPGHLTSSFAAVILTYWITNTSTINTLMDTILCCSHSTKAIYLTNSKPLWTYNEQQLGKWSECQNGYKKIRLRLRNTRVLFKKQPKWIKPIGYMLKREGNGIDETSPVSQLFLHFCVGLNPDTNKRDIPL